eukprot:14243219-Alexandrium_andersonii.AAC.1
MLCVRAQRRKVGAFLLILVRCQRIGRVFCEPRARGRPPQRTRLPGPPGSSAGGARLLLLLL